LYLDVLQGYKEETAFVDISTPSDCLKKDLSPVFHKFYPQMWLDQTFKNLQCQQSKETEDETEKGKKRKKLGEEFERLKDHSMQIFMIHSGAVQIKRAELTEFFVFYGNMHGININPVSSSGIQLIKSLCFLRESMKKGITF
jgi:hypothetical protein